MTNRRIFYLAILLIDLGIFIIFLGSSNPPTDTTTTQSNTPIITLEPSLEDCSSTQLLENYQKDQIIRVIDGDTIEVSLSDQANSGYKLRYIGIDTPETGDPRRPVGCFGKRLQMKINS